MASVGAGDHQGQTREPVALRIVFHACNGIKLGNSLPYTCQPCRIVDVDRPPESALSARLSSRHIWLNLDLAGTFGRNSRNNLHLIIIFDQILSTSFVSDI